MSCTARRLLVVGPNSDACTTRMPLHAGDPVTAGARTVAGRDIGAPDEPAMNGWKTSDQGWRKRREWT